MESNSSDESSVTDYSTESSDEDGMETAQVNGTRLLLPQGLCDKEDVFKEFFTPHLWNSLSNEHKTHLQTFLPTFPDNDENEKTITLQRLFNYDTFKFTNPLQEFHEQLKAGYFRPDIARMRKMIRKAERKEARHRYKNHKEKLKNSILESRKKLLNQIRNLPPGCEPKTEKIDVTDLDLIRHRTKRRYFQILTSIRSKTEDACSSDENYLENTSISLSRKQKRHLNSVKNSLQNSDQKFFCSVTGKSSTIDLERFITPNSNPFYINDEAYRNLLKTYKKRKQEDPEDIELHTRNITLSDVIHRTQLPYSKVVVQIPPSKNIHHTHSSDNNKPPCRKKIRKTNTSSSSSNNYYHQSVHNSMTNPTSNSEYENNNSDSDSIIDAVTVPSSFKTKKPEIIRTPKLNKISIVNKTNIKTEVKTEQPEEIAMVVPVSQEITLNSNTNMISPITNYSQYGKIMPVTLSDLEGIDMMNLPIDLDNSDIDILEVNNKPELMQETHSNFLSLIRDVICSTNEHRMNFQTLEKRLQTWQESPISPLNDWYSSCENWCGVLRSAINFLCGNSTELPNDFVPYLEFKQHLDAYQWIGAGRDGDNLLAPLCKFWLDHRDEIKNVKVKDEVDVEISDRSQTPPPPRYPTNWTIRKATQEEVEKFREQEKRRYENPHKAFTYKCNGYESVVAPLKGIYNPSTSNTKARGHSILTADRPNFVTILSLVRDATARLPNGEGTRGDIVELLKQSQYISSNATDNVLQTVVSGALDRMHTQFDPCVKYDTKRKIWIYLHRNRSEEDFEKIHQHLQGVAKTPKKTTKKSPSKPKIKQITNDKPKQPVKENEMTKKPNQATTQMVAASSSNVTKSSNSLLISNNIQQREPSPPTIQILENIQMSPSIKTQEDREISEALQAIVENRIATPKLTKTKGLVKILSPSQSKSLILATKNEKPKQQILARQLVQMGTTPSQTILLQKTDGNIENKSSQQIIHTVPTQLQNIKNVTLLRNSSQSSTQSPVTTSIIQTVAGENTETQNSVGGVKATATAVTINEQSIPPGIQIKTPNNLTLAQQQQILQTIKQKILPQTVLATPQQQQQLILKQKLTQVQKQNQNSSPSISLLGQTSKINTEAATSKANIVTQSPVVAKVLTNAAGQVISVESLLAHQKQHGSLPQGATIRVAGSKGNQPNIIHLSGTTKQNIAQFTVASQNNLIALTTQPKLVMATAPTSTVTSTSTTLNKTRDKQNRSQLTKLPTKVTQQLINAKIIQNIDGTQKVVQPKLIVGQTSAPTIKRIGPNSATKNIALQKPTLSIAANSNSIRMANLNLTHIAGKPVLLASKGGAIQNLQGQNVILQQSAAGPSLVLQNNKNVQPSNVQPSTNSGGNSNLNIINQGNVVLGSQVKMQQPQVVFKNNTVNQVTQGHLVLGGQPVRLHTTGTSTQRLVLASQGQGGQIVAQQILLPAGFQGTAINIKALQGVKVIPIAQAHGQNRGVQSRQVFARVVNPTITTKTQQNNLNVTEKIEETNSQEDL